MKKLLMLSAVAIVFSTTPVLADHHSDGDKEGRGGHKGKMFEKHDADGNGTISKDEFLKAHEEKFSKIDTDGNGEISKEEAKAGHEARREKMKERREERKEKREASE